MLSHVRQSMMLAACVLVLTGAGLHAQVDDSAPKPKAEVPAPAPRGVLEVKPETYVVRDADGRLVPMPNVTLEQIHEWMEKELRSSDTSASLPAYTLQELLITGTANASRADLLVEVSVRLQQDGWVKIPLRFSDAILRAPAEYGGSGAAFVSVEEDSGIYTCWIRGSRDEPHRISMAFAVPVRQLGSESRLALQVPHATSSSLDLRIPVANVSADVSDGLLEVKEGASETRLLVTGLTPDFQINWTDSAAALVESRPLLKADIRTVIKVDDEREIGGEVNLSAESLRGAFESFVVRLPAGMDLSPRQPTRPEYRITDLGGADESQGTRLQVKLERRVTEVSDVQLLTTLTPVANGKVAEFEAGGVQLEDAVGQTQMIDFFVEDDLSVSWRPGPNVQRTIVPDDAKDAIEARFESMRRSLSLRFQVSPREAQITVDPTYVVHLESGRIRLSATLKYEVRRTSTYGVNVYLPNWRIDQVLPETIVDSPALDRDKREPLHIPLKAAAVQEDGEFTLQIEAVYTSEPTDEAVSVVLPRPEAKMLAAAPVVVLPADNVAVTVVEDQLQGLEQESSPPPDIELPQRQQSPLFFRARSDSKSAVLTAEIGRRERSVSITPHCHMDINGSRVKVRQTLEYRIAYEPLRTIELTAPSSVLQPGNLQILEEKEALPFVRLADQEGDGQADTTQADETIADAPVRLEVDLLSDRIGRWSTKLEYEVPLPELPADEPISIRVPLVSPVTGSDTTVTSYELDIDTSQGLQTSVTGDDWETVEKQDTPDLASTLVSRSPPSFVELLVSEQRGGVSAATVVHKAWFQTWLQGKQRRDRAVFEIATATEQIEIRLPGDATFQCAAVDGRLVEVDLDPRAPQIALSLGAAGDEEASSRVVELWYVSSGEGLLSGAVDLAPAVLTNATRSKHTYWSLATPSTSHLLLPPRAATPEMSWVRRGVFWHRTADLEQEELESWIGASSQERLPPSLNNYLFSSFGETTNLRSVLASRSVILLVISGIALLTGLLLIRFRALRHPAVVFAGGLVLVSTVLLYPDLATAACQASLLGIGLVFSAVLLKWIVDWRQARRSIIRGTTFASPDSKTVKAAALSLDEHPAHTPATTASMPADENVGEASA